MLTYNHMKIHISLWQCDWTIFEGVITIFYWKYFIKHFVLATSLHFKWEFLIKIAAIYSLLELFHQSY